MGWIIAAILGSTLAVLGSVLGVREHLWLSKAAVVEGTVTELIRGSASKGRPTYRPRVAFTARDGSQHTFTRSYSSNPPGFRVGERIHVAYDARTYEARILTFGQRFGFAVILGVSGLALGVIAGLFVAGRVWIPRIYLQ